MKLNTPGTIKSIPEHVIQQVRDLDIVDVVNPYLNLSKNGSGYKAICLWHEDHSPSLTINPAKGIFKCFPCGESGDAIKIVMKVKGVEFPEAVRMIAADHKIEIPEQELSAEQQQAYQKREALFIVNQWAATWFSSQLRHPENALALEYVRSKRNWNDESIEDFSIGYAPPGWQNLLTAAKKEGYHEDKLQEAGLIGKNDKDGKENIYDCFQDRIMFPIQNKNGKVSGFSGRSLTPIFDKDGREIHKYINTSDTEVYHKREIMYGFRAAKRYIKDQKNVYLVEGNADVIRLHQEGILNCVAISGTTLTQENIDELKKITPCITLIPDMDPPKKNVKETAKKDVKDPAGQASANRSAKLIIENGLYCKIIQLPKGDEKQDPDSFFTNKDQFDHYEKEQRRDYIYFLAEQGKDIHIETDQKVSFISTITSLVSCLPAESHVQYLDELGKIIPPKSGWKLKNIKPAAAESDLKHKKDEKTEQSLKTNSDQAKNDHSFYYIEKDQAGQFKGIKIDRVKFIEKLKEKGYLRFDAGIDSYRFLKAQNNTIAEVSITLITDDFIKFIENIDGYQHEWDSGSKLIDSFILKRKMFDGIDTYFSHTLLKRLNPEKPVIIKKDTRHEKHIFYQNGFVSVNKDGCMFHDYSELDSYIWSNQILKRDFFTDTTIDDQASIFQKFIWNISNQDEERFKSMQTIIGYVLHNFMECKLFAVILTDSKISQNGEANGRTGKTLWGKGLSHMLNTDKIGSVFLELNGKDFKPTNKFKYEDANLDTQLIHINDIYHNYNIENSFNDITEGIKIDKKNEKPITIRPKLIFSSNKTIIIEGVSAIDRVIQFEFSEHYDSENNPSKEFGSYNEDGTFVPHWFFTDWDKSEWARFDYFMISCIIEYFKHGLIRPTEINLSKRTLKDHTSEEFINFMQDAISENGISTEVSENGIKTQVDFIIKKSERCSKQLAFEMFIKLNPDFNNPKFKQANFTHWIRRYAKYQNITIIESRSNSKDYFTFE